MGKGVIITSEMADEEKERIERETEYIVVRSLMNRTIVLTPPTYTIIKKESE